ncbi:MAG: DUF1150 family protein [Pseudomonadota bacterium]
MTNSIKNDPSLTPDVSRMIYIRAINEGELDALPDEALMGVQDTDALFVLTNGEGKKLAIVEGHAAAIATARANELMPVSLH